MGKSARCRVCGKPLSFHQQVSGRVCDDWRCKSAVLDQEMARHRQNAAAATGVRYPETYPIVVVPDDTADIDRLPQWRKQAHLNFLYDLGVEAAAVKRDGRDILPEADPDAAAPPAAMASCVCAACRGACCNLGKTHAFLDAVSIRRFMTRSGIHDPLEMVYAYFAFLPEKTVIDACVYQTGQGCTLPRWMRADICNAYRCKGLKEAERMIHHYDADRFYVVVRENNRIARSAFVNGRVTRHFPSQEKGQIKV
jgi:hypothetical protein